MMSSFLTAHMKAAARTSQIVLKTIESQVDTPQPFSLP